MAALLPQYIYEHRKGVRRLFLLTMTPIEAHAVCRRLEREGIAFHVQTVNATKMNVFFGQAACVEVVSRVVVQPLCRLSAEEDFILGSLLGYDSLQQCERYLLRRGAPASESTAEHCCEPGEPCAAEQDAVPHASGLGNLGGVAA